MKGLTAAALTSQLNKEQIKTLQTQQAVNSATAQRLKRKLILQLLICKIMKQ